MEIKIPIDSWIVLDPKAELAVVFSKPLSKIHILDPFNEVKLQRLITPAEVMPRHKRAA